MAAGKARCEPKGKTSNLQHSTPNSKRGQRERNKSAAAFTVGRGLPALPAMDWPSLEMVGRAVPCAPPPANPCPACEKSSVQTRRDERRSISHASRPCQTTLRRAEDCPPYLRAFLDNEFQYHFPMPRPVRKKLPHTVPQWVPEGSSFFITIKCLPPGRNQLCQAGIGDHILAAMAYNHQKLLWHCRICLLMPDHLHAIIAFPCKAGMKTLVTNWKKFTALDFGVKWQRDFFDHRLRNHYQLQEKTEYILMNPVRKGLCERMEDWVWIYRPTDRPPPLLDGR